MILSLLLRIGFELYSLRQSRKLSFIKNSATFKHDLTKYYIFRKIVHFLVTPFSIAVYIIGFLTLLPLFKATMSAGFYAYILISSVVLLFVLGLFIFKQIGQELSKLKQLQMKE
ncbi:hypothetical protein Q2T41_09975 [Maribacter confluentis]|uniref:DUF2721 domain-containing protein n=1 Tax=Maribacter confluentis TaxID=1656093 RepID=A0ABT8RPY7_9FLAO|nr:hypothetical protein [Maribacter confluentis]MDO1512981.1 hypothetical protein [Maribacter confluentis]